MNKRLLLLCGLTALLSACGYGWERESNQYPPSNGNRTLVAGTPRTSPLMPDEYIVEAGESLGSIAARKSLSATDLASWNNLGRDYAIVPGQLLRLSPPSYRNPVSAADGSVAYPASESSMQGAALPARTPLGKPMQIPVGPGGTATPSATAPAALPSPAPVITTGRNGVGYSAIAPETPIIAPAIRPVPAAPMSAPAAAVAPAPVMLPPVTAATPAPANSSGSSWRWPVQGTVVKAFAPGVGSKGVDISVDLGTPVRASAAGRVAYSGSALKGYGELIVIKHDEVYLTAYGYNRKRLVKEGEQVKAGQVIAESGLGPEQNTVVHFEIRENGNPVNPLPFLPKQ